MSRVKRANEWPADLFLSIHHDSVPARFLDVWDHEEIERKYSDRFRGHSMFVSHENPQAAASLYFAQLLGGELKARALKYTPHYAEAFMQERRRELLDPTAGVYRYDQLIVLKSTRMPAVLFEAGSIVNFRDEELVISTPAHRSIIAAAATQAVESSAPRAARQSDTNIARRMPSARKDRRWSSHPESVNRPPGRSSPALPRSTAEEGDSADALAQRPLAPPRR